MSFGLLTAVNVEDVPKILHNCARGYRKIETARYPETWKLIAEELDKIAAELVSKIEEWKLIEPPPKRVRIRL